MNDKKDKVTLPSFQDLDFQRHPNAKGIMARLVFGSRDQFEISVVANSVGNERGKGGSFYGNVSDNEYEVAIFFDDKMLPLSVSDDVLGWQSPVEITKLIHQAWLNDFAWVTLLYSLRSDRRKDLGLDD